MLSTEFEHIQPYLELLAALSIFTFILSLLLIPWYIGRLPQNHFILLKTKPRLSNFSPGELFLAILRNMLGIFLVIAGIIMLFLPGQGILTILIGILCMSFPGKHTLLIYLITRPSIKRSLNWTRRKLSRPPFLWD